MIEPFEETRKINQMISLGGYTGMTENQFFEQQIKLWYRSRESTVYKGLHRVGI